MRIEEIINFWAEKNDFNSFVLESYTNYLMSTHNINYEQALNYLLNTEDVTDVLATTVEIFQPLNISGLYKKYQDGLSDTIIDLSRVFETTPGEYMTAFLDDDPLIIESKTKDVIFVNTAYGLILAVVGLSLGGDTDEAENIFQGFNQSKEEYTI